MKSKKYVLIIGGDSRQEYLQSAMEKNGCNCKNINSADALKNIEETISLADVIVLPLPVSKDGVTVYSNNSEFVLKIEDLLLYLEKKHTVIGGMISEKVLSDLENASGKVYDYYLDESLIIRNSYLTALGALKLMLENTNDTMLLKKVLITGFGNVAKCSARILSAVGCEVYIAARSDSQLTDAQCCGYKTVPLSEAVGSLYPYDYIVNTVPHRIFSKRDIFLMKEECFYIELASAPFGAHKDDFSGYGKKYIFAPSLPGRFFPKASAQAIETSIKHYI